MWYLLVRSQTIMLEWWMPALTVFAPNEGPSFFEMIVQWFIRSFVDNVIVKQKPNDSWPSASLKSHWNHFSQFVVLLFISPQVAVCLWFRNNKHIKTKQIPQTIHLIPFSKMESLNYPFWRNPKNFSSPPGLRGLGETSEVRNLHRCAAGFPEANLVRMGWLKCRVDGWWVRIWLTCWSFLVLRSHKSGRMVWVIAHMPYMGVVYSPIHEWWIFMIN